MKHAASRELYAYWNRVRRDAPAPNRRDIEPGDIRNILADTFILEGNARDRFPVRLAGTRMCGLYCREIRDGDFLDLWADGDRNAVATLVTAITTNAAAAVLSMEALSKRGRLIACEVLLLPLRHSGPDYDRILGSCAPLDRPYWLGSDPLVGQALTSLRLIWPDAPPPRIRRAAVNAPPCPLPLALPARERGRGHLTVLNGGKV